MTPAEARAALEQAPGVVVVDDPLNREYPQPQHAAGRDPVYVGRIRADVSLPGAIALWVVADNLRKGAALNAVQIAELLYSAAPASQASGAPQAERAAATARGSSSSSIAG